jgi:hypothetical protein
MVDLLGIPVDERIKLMTAMLVGGMDEQVNQTIDSTVGAELKELASHCLKLLAETKAKEAGI